MAKKLLSSQTLGSNSTSSSSYSNVTNKSSSNAKNWNTSKVSKKTRNALLNAEKPFASKYESYLNNTLGDIQNRKDFSYDVNKDALYQQYKKQYQALGNQAMQETMANASSLTGGYGSSYATTAGQQAYNNYMQQLNDIVPDLYAQARTNYDTKTSNLYNEASLYAGLDSEAYNRWSENRNYYQTKYDNEWNRNAVSHSSQIDKSSQTEKNSSSSNSSSSSSTYTPKTKATLVLPSYSEIKDAVSDNKTAEKNVQGLCSTYGISTDGMLSRSAFRANGMKDDKGTAYDNYSTYVAHFLDDKINAAYSKKARKNSNNKKGSD